MMYELLFYDGWGREPAYYLVGSVEGETPEEALRANLAQAAQRVRDLLGLDMDDISDEQIQETTYVVRENGLVSARDVALQRST